MKSLDQKYKPGLYLQPSARNTTSRVFTAFLRIQKIPFSPLMWCQAFQNISRLLYWSDASPVLAPPSPRSPFSPFMPLSPLSPVKMDRKTDRETHRKC